MTEQAKKWFKEKLKVIAASSPALAAFTIYPAESLAFLKMLKEAGFEAGTITVIVGIAYFLRKDVMRIVNKLETSLSTTNETLKNLGDNYEEHRKQDKIRLDEGQKQFDLITNKFLENDQKFMSIESRLQGIIPTISPNELKELAERVAHESDMKDPDLTP